MYQVRYTKAAKEDLLRLYDFLLGKDLQAARRALEAIQKSVDFLQDFPFTCRKATPESNRQTRPSCSSINRPLLWPPQSREAVRRPTDQRADEAARHVRKAMATCQNKVAI